MMLLGKLSLKWSQSQGDLCSWGFWDLPARREKSLQSKYLLQMPGGRLKRLQSFFWEWPPLFLSIVFGGNNHISRQGCYGSISLQDLGNLVLWFLDLVEFYGDFSQYTCPWSGLPHSSLIISSKEECKGIAASREDFKGRNLLCGLLSGICMGWIWRVDTTLLYMATNFSGRKQLC